MTPYPESQILTRVSIADKNGFPLVSKHPLFATIVIAIDHLT
jgi:hypothetical protein